MPAAWRRALAFAALLLLLQAAGGGTHAALRFTRVAAGQGEWWRLFSAHFVHLGWTHTLLNIAGVLLCCALAPRLFDRRVWFKAAGLALGIGVLLWWGSPGVPDYVGLSGVLYGLFAAGLWPQAVRGDRHAALALAACAAWMLWQWGMGPAPSEEKLIGGRIVAIAHVYGFCLGSAGAATAAGWARLFGPSSQRS